MSTTLATPIGTHEGARTGARTAAAWAAGGYLAILVLAIFANFLAVGAVFDPDDARATLTELSGSETTFRYGVVAFLAVFLVDVVVAWALWALLRPVHADLAVVSAWFRLVYTVFLGVALAFLYVALQVVAGAAPGFDTDQQAGQVQLAFHAFEITWLVGLAAFGVHLVLVGRLLLRTAGAPRVLAVLLTIAGAAYLVDTVAHVVLADYREYADAFLALVAVPSVVGELGLTVWLILVATGRRAAPVAR